MTSASASGTFTAESTVSAPPMQKPVTPTFGLSFFRYCTADYRLHTYSAEDFPRLPDLETVASFAADAEALFETVAQVARSASRDESRPVLTGILARFEPGKLVMGASDSYRLAAA